MMNHITMPFRGLVFRAVALTSGCWIAAASAGCSESDGHVQLATYPVTGKVLLADGAPLATGAVVFTLPEKGMEFEAPLEADGSFSLKSPLGEGVPEGSYKVRVQPDTSKPVAPKARSARRAPAFPAKYGDETTSGLTAAVKPAANDLEPFKLVK